jgi:phage-related protein
MKPIRFLGNSLDCLREFPIDARQDAGYQLDRVQRGKQAHDFKPMPAIGKGVEEIRVRDETGAFRVIYTTRLDSPVRSMCSTLSRRRRRPHQDATSSWRKRDSSN